MTATIPPDPDRLTEIGTTLKLLVKQLDKDLPRLEARLTKVERFMWLALGMATASGLPQVVQLFGG